jgi:uncharacterized integral membrane protein
MNTSLVNIYLPIFGGILLLLLLAVYLIGSFDKLHEKQSFDGFGVKLEVSILTIFILVAVIAIFVGILINYLNFEKQAKTDKATIARLREDSTVQKGDLAYIKSTPITYQFKLADLGDNVPPPELKYIKMLFYKNFPEGGIPLNVSRSAKGFKATLDFSRDDLRDDGPSIYLIDTRSNKTWVYENFDPFIPTIELTPKK